MLQPLERLGANRQSIQDAIDTSLRLDEEGRTDVLLVRHAEPARTSNPDPMLSCLGLQQAESLAAVLRHQHVEAVFSAPERRALQTALLLASEGARPVYVLEPLADIDHYRDTYTELTPEDYASRFDVALSWDALPGFEPSARFRRRAVHAIDRARVSHSGRCIVVVTHASLINAYIATLLDLRVDHLFVPDHTSVSRVRWCQGRNALMSLNDLSHLSPEPSHSNETQAFYAAFTAVNNPLNRAT